jgi:hypothetical protein
MKKMIILISCCISLLFMVSCTGTQTALEKNRGRAVETAKFNHAVNPGRINHDTIEGTTGLAGDAMIQNYNDSFRQQKREEIVNIIQLR